MTLKQSNSNKNSLLKRYLKIRSSIYGRVVYIIIISSIFLFVLFGIIFRQVNEGYMKSVIRQRGSDVALLVGGALYYSMLENDRSRLQSTLDIINQMSGIDDVNLYDKNEDLAYSSFSKENEGHSNPNCKECHESITSVFHGSNDFYKIIEIDTECEMNQNNVTNRHLLIRSPILNEPSCYTANCHAHHETEKILGTLVIKIPLKELDETQEKLSKDFYLLAALTTFTLLTFLIIFTRKKIKHPLNDLLSASIAVAKGDRSTRIEINPRQLNDIKMVSKAFNEMLDNIESANNELHNWSQQLEYKIMKKTEELGQAQNELINVEKIASLGKLSLSVAHEINNPLSGILIYTKLIQKQMLSQECDSPKKEPVLKNLKMIETETKRCGDIVKGLLDFSRKDQDSYENKHANEILKETADLMKHSMEMSKIDFYCDFSGENDFIFCNPNQLKQACIAILVNASEAVSENGEITFKTSNPDEKHLKIEISDNGSGIDPENLSHIFEPFFSTKQKTRGIGLGLAIVHGIVHSHKGTIDIKSQVGEGTSIFIELPLVEI